MAGEAADTSNGVGLHHSEISMLGLEGIGVADRESVVTSLALEPTEICILLVRRRESDQSNDLAVFTGFDICYPEGQPISVGLRRFCQVGTRLLLGRARDIDRALVRITLYPLASLEATLTRPGRGVRCRRFYALRKGNEIRLHFHNGTPTEVVFDDRKDDAVVLHWLRSGHIRPETPFWFDLASQLESDGFLAGSTVIRGRPPPT